MDKVTKIVEAAATIAKQLHEGPVDKAGEDYFSGHLTSVASMEKTWQEQVVGYLHDASEDTPHSVEEISFQQRPWQHPQRSQRGRFSDRCVHRNCLRQPQRTYLV